MNVITEIRLLVKVNDLFKQIKQETSMKLSIHSVVQVLATVVQFANGLGSIVPAGKPQAILAASIGLVQAVAALIALFQAPPVKK